MVAAERPRRDVKEAKPLDDISKAFPEWSSFAQAVRERRPDAGTWCEAWTVRDVVIHQAGNSEELGRVLGGHLNGQTIATRGFEEREGPYRAMSDRDLWDALTDRVRALAHACETAEVELGADTEVAWTGRTMKVAWFAEHMREELVLHRWDITGDDATSQGDLAQPWMTEHSVSAVGRPLLLRGSARVDLGGGDIEGRLRSPGTDDVVVKASSTGNTIELASPTGAATVESDPATRVLLLWGRRPADPARWRSDVGPEKLAQLRTLLSGY
jgi:hypothetical protein